MSKEPWRAFEAHAYSADRKVHKTEDIVFRCEGCRRPLSFGDKYYVWLDDVRTCPVCTPSECDHGVPTDDPCNECDKLLD